jgi:hypothetical protein
MRHEIFSREVTGPGGGKSANAHTKNPFLFTCPYSNGNVIFQTFLSHWEKYLSSYIILRRNVIEAIVSCETYSEISYFYYYFSFIFCFLFYFCYCFMLLRDWNAEPHTCWASALPLEKTPSSFIGIFLNIDQDPKSGHNLEFNSFGYAISH